MCGIVGYCGSDPALPIIWGVGFVALALVNVFNLVRPPPSFKNESTTATRMLMVVPLYAWMTIVGGVWFLFLEHYVEGAT